MASGYYSSRPFLVLPLLLLVVHISSASLKLPLHHTLTLSSSSSPLHPSTAVSPVISGASAGTGQYFVTLHLGSPPQPLHLVADTGSDLIWTRCSSSSSSSSLVDPLRTFHPLLSSTFCLLHCYNPLCRLVLRLPHSPCNRHPRVPSACHYNYTYGDGSFSAGIFASETTTSKNHTMAFTRLITNPVSPTFHYVNVTSVSVNGVKLHIDPSLWALDEIGSGGTVLDSGTTLTLLIEPAYSEILAAMRRQMEGASPIRLVCERDRDQEAEDAKAEVRDGRGGRDEKEGDLLAADEKLLHRHGGRGEVSGDTVRWRQRKVLGDRQRNAAGVLVGV